VNDWKEGAKRALQEKSLIYGLSLVPCPHAEERGQGRALSSYLSHTHPCGKAKKRKEPESKLR
jgi:hypothetical protein